MTTPTPPGLLCPGCFVVPATLLCCTHCGYDPGAPPPLNALAPRRILNQHLIIGRVLGQPGGFGITYLAYDQRLNTRLAVKEYLPRDIATRAADNSRIQPYSTHETSLYDFGLQQFEQEARTLAQFDHANIVRVRQFFEANATAYLVMDYYSGETLAEYIERQPQGRLPEKMTLQLIEPIFDGLRAVHAQNLLHRDIKPTNLYLARTPNGGLRPILIDFGAARYAVGEKTRSLSVILTPGYAPLEQYSRKGLQGPWTDVYAVAAVLYRSMTSVTPPPAPERVVVDELMPASVYGISDRISEALRLGLAVHAKDRPQTIDDFRALLQGRSLPPQPHQQDAISVDQNTVEPPASTLIYAGFWKRALAAFIDSAVLLLALVFVGLISALIGLILPVIEALIDLSGLVLIWLYYALMESSSKQATIGKIALDMKVTDLAGKPISFGRASGRYFGKIISTLILFIGYFVALFTKEKQTLHDIMADCVVVENKTPKPGSSADG